MKAKQVNKKGKVAEFVNMRGLYPYSCPGKVPSGLAE